MKQKNRISIDDRINLQCCISKHLSLKDTAKVLRKNRSTIYRELTTYYCIRDGRHTCEHCRKRFECQSNGVVTTNMPANQPCFESIVCHFLKKFPYVCNGCENKNKCNREKRYYDCIKAENRSLRNRIGTRKSKRLSLDKISLLDSVVSPLIFKGQSLHHIYESNPILKTICCERTIRRLIYDRYFEAKAHDLPRYTRFKHKSMYVGSNEKALHNVERLYKRTYTDLQRYLKGHPKTRVVQFDSVVGKRDDELAILTITFPEERFQFGKIIKKGDPESVYARLHCLFNQMSDNMLKQVFPVLLSDNGIEFSTFHNLEKFNLKVFFTNPYRSNDKAECERNHEFIRYIIPKGKTLDIYNQNDLNLMFSHINSYIRESNKNKTPYELVKESFGSEFLDLIGIKYVNPNDVILRPNLLRK